MSLTTFTNLRTEISVLRAGIAELGGNPNDYSVSPWVLRSVTVERDSAGLWKHPAYPHNIPAADLHKWLKSRGFTFTVNYLIPDAGNTPGDFSGYEVRRPFGLCWFLFSIDVSHEGDAIAVWVARI